MWWTACPFAIGLISVCFAAASEGSPICQQTSECVQDGFCHRLKTANQSICVCTRTCSGAVPLTCEKPKHCHDPTASNGESPNTCVKKPDAESGLCQCPSTDHESCFKRDLKINWFNVTTDTPYQGDDVVFFCCINMDPRSVRVKYLHNDTDTRKVGALKSDFDKCWTLNITSVQYRHSGKYRCTVSLQNWNDSREIFISVRTPITVNVSATALNSTSLKVDWTINKGANHLGLNLQLRPIDPIEELASAAVLVEFPNVSGTSKVVSDLQAGTVYNVTVFSLPLKGNKTASDSILIQMPDAKPGQPIPDDPTLSGYYTPFKCHWKWLPPVEPTGRVSCYKLQIIGKIRTTGDDSLVAPHTPRYVICSQKDRTRVAMNTSCISPASALHCELYDLQPNRNYSASVVAVNTAGESDPVQLSTDCMTRYNAPDFIKSPMLTLVNDTVQVELIQPDSDNGPIGCYYLAVVVGRVDDIEDVSTSRERLFRFLPFNGTLDADLVDQLPFAYVAESYKKVPTEPFVLGDGINTGEKCPREFIPQDSMEIQQPANDVPLAKGFAYFGLLIVDVDTMTHRDLPKRSSMTASLGFSKLSDPLVYGDDLKPEAKEKSVPVPEGLSLEKHVILPVFLALMIAIIMVLLWYIFIKKRYYKLWCMRSPTFDSLGHVPLNPSEKGFPPILAADLPEEYLRRHKDSDFLFTVEFERLPHNKFDTTASDRPENAQKNRYNDIKAYDVTRVKLQNLSGIPNSDYINANFVQGYKGRRLFIAAQGPKEDTVGDFWRMIYENRVSIVVMVTNLHEKYRTMCYKYWPDQESAQYCLIRVEVLESSTYTDYCVRKFKVTRLNGTDGDNPDAQESFESLTVLQYHYIGWHDYRAPDCTIGLLRFLLRLRKLDEFSDSAVLVHCSAGVGRTGTFIAIDAMIEQLTTEGRADIFGFVSGMRRERNFMVQSLEQYVFIFKALAEWHLFGDTDVEAERIHDHVSSLREAADGIDGTMMLVEYNKLALSLEDAKSHEFASKDCNIGKNRFENYVPFDRNRVILLPVLGQVDASYINASTVQGYSRPYILAQDPLANTLPDFWRCVWEQNISAIVMLSNEQDLLEDEVYWPHEIGKGLLFGEKDSFGVQLVSVEDQPHFVIRKCSLTNNKEKSVREVWQFAYRDWPAGDLNTAVIPYHTGSFLDLIGKVQQRQTGSASSGPLMVHCRTGSHRSGLYCAVSLLLERLKSEARVDVFQTVKSLRAQRVYVIQNLAQFEFCYQAVLDYLEPFR